MGGLGGLGLRFPFLPIRNQRLSIRSARRWEKKQACGSWRKTGSSMTGLRSHAHSPARTSSTAKPIAGASSVFERNDNIHERFPQIYAESRPLNNSIRV